MFEIRAFHLVSCFSGKAHKPLNQNKRSKNQLWVWCHCNLCTLSGLCLFCNSSHTKLPFPDIFDELLFLCASLFYKNLSHHSLNEWPLYWSFKLAESNQLKVNIKSRTRLMWNADMWLTNLPNATLSPLQMSNQIAKFNAVVES